MKKILLSVFAAGAFVATGQIAVRGVAPASVVQNFNFSHAETDSPAQWAQALDFTVPGTYVEDTLMMVNDGSSGTNAQGHPIAEEGCNTLVNDLTGKIAVVYRNTCEFGAKAKKAQDAGAVAVVIINRDDEVIAMGGGTNGPSVTIPVIMLSSSDGAILTNAMLTDDVVLFIGNKAGLYGNDLGFNEELLLTPVYNGVHSLLVQNAGELTIPFGARVWNFGNHPQTGASLNVKVTGPESSVVYDETVTFNLDGLSGSVIDSVEIFPGETLTLPDFSLSAYENGKYTVLYTLSPTTDSTDEFLMDNTYSIDFVINDSYVSRSRLDPVTLKPMAESQVRVADGTQAYSDTRYCFTFRDANASRIAVVGVDGSASVDTTVSSSLLGKEIFMDFYEWNDANDYVGGTVTYDALNNVGSTSFSFENDVVEDEVHFEFDDPILLNDNQIYLACVVDYGEKLRVGFDRGVDYNATNQQDNLLANPLFINPDDQSQNWYGGGFGSDLTPAFAIKAVDVNSAGIKAVGDLLGSAFPNPTSDVVKLNVPMDGNATVTVTDLSGRTVVKESVSFLNSSAKIDLKNVKSGMYVINVNYENGSKTKFNVVKN